MKHSQSVNIEKCFVVGMLLYELNFSYIVEFFFVFLRNKSPLRSEVKHAGNIFYKMARSKHSTLNDKNIAKQN